MTARPPPIGGKGKARRLLDAYAFHDPKPELHGSLCRRGAFNYEQVLSQELRRPNSLRAAHDFIKSRSA